MQPRHVRVFLSSPNDVQDERQAALRVLARLRRDPLLRDRFTFQEVAWEAPGSRTPLLATMLPQQAVNRGMALPSECDWVTVILARRLGTLLADSMLKADGSRYRSGTEWEYEDAIEGFRRSGRPHVVVYRRVGLPPPDGDDVEAASQHRQVVEFCARFRNPDGSLSGGLNEYTTPEEFEEHFENDLKVFLERLLPEPRVSYVPPAFSGSRSFEGRELDLRRLDEAWEDPNTNVLVMQAWGGVGKSTLLAHWYGLLAGDSFRGARSLFSYSFEGTAGDIFVDRAQRFFGDPVPALGTPEEKGERLAALIQKERNILLLDGFQWVQEQEGEVGRIKSPALQTLIHALALRNEGLCIIATRLPVTDIAYLSQATAPVHELKHLSPQAGARVLRSLGVRIGPEDEFLQASEEVQGHPLTLNILGSYLADAWHGDIGRRDHLRLMEADGEQGGQARRVLASYEEYLTTHRRPALAALRVISLFHRPAQPEAIAALLARPAIVGLTDDLVALKPPDWNRVISHLRKHRLMLEASDSGNPHVLDAHPLVRDYFSEKLRIERPAAFRDGHRRLSRHYRESRPEIPENSVQMGPLYLAVIHGCLGGAYEEVLNGVYWPRIKRGELHYNTRTLGAFVADLYVLANFFKSRWDEIHEAVPVGERARLQYEVAFDLRALGRLEESVGPIRSSLARRIRLREWNAAAQTAGDLALLNATIGQLDRALLQARHGVAYADEGGCPFECARARSNVVNPLVQLGRLDEALRAFREAERIVARHDAGCGPPTARRPTLQSYWFYELLLDLKEYDRLTDLASRPRADQTPTGMVHLDAALMETILARVCMGRALAGDPREGGPDPTLMKEAKARLDRALAEIGQARTFHHQPRVLLARAALFRLLGEWDRARESLAQADVIAVRSAMKLHRADIGLETARLHLARGDRRGARVEFERARDDVARIGYHRRDAEVEELARALRS